MQIYACSGSCHIFFAKNNFFISAMINCEAVLCAFRLGIPTVFDTKLVCKRSGLGAAAECDNGAGDKNRDARHH